MRNRPFPSLAISHFSDNFRTSVPAPLPPPDHEQRHEKRWKKRLRMKEESERRILVREINEAIEKQIDRW